MIISGFGGIFRPKVAGSRKKDRELRPEQQEANQLLPLVGFFAVVSTWVLK